RGLHEGGRPVRDDEGMAGAAAGGRRALLRDLPSQVFIPHRPRFAVPSQSRGGVQRPLVCSGQLLSAILAAGSAVRSSVRPLRLDLLEKIAPSGLWREALVHPAAPTAYHKDSPAKAAPEDAHASAPALPARLAPPAPSCPCPRRALCPSPPRSTASASASTPPATATASRSSAPTAAPPPRPSPSWRTAPATTACASASTSCTASTQAPTSTSAS